MTRPVKREPGVSSGSTRTKSGKYYPGEFRTVKRERLNKDRVESGEDESAQESQQDVMKGRDLRFLYLTVINEINEGREDLSKVDSNNFSNIINVMEKLHEQVQKPREQVVDAEALQGIANTLVTSIKSQCDESVSPSDFISCLMREFGQSNSLLSVQEILNWKDIGLCVSPIFRKGHGCCTMLGPMSTGLKLRQAVTSRKRVRPLEIAQPEELVDNGAENTDTDKNMRTMFHILGEKQRVKLESLMLNRRSFAQTVENLFALSFLVKDGRAVISVDENGCHLVSPRNAPAASSVMSREVTYSHFVFRFDFEDWKLMKDVEPLVEEMMPHREFPNSMTTHSKQIQQQTVLRRQTILSSY